ncbi:hypothetical protein [Streptomyces chromofuscus]|uniref:hypothetical protein n=1 Tax=Streptomyces chromofuscus TaxID=42881 RepID=UPI00167A2E7F|nr:hypothetical protein [Streptomyces chromofuscus]GGT16389.1 hypothetical protein GCM10010254_41320 [Streptomyces chromofuscus]
MNRHSIRAAVTLCAATALLGTLGTASGAPSNADTVEHRPKEPVLVDCFWHAEVRPTDFILACGDGNSRLADLKWQRWDRGAAVAEGINWVNDCKPYCAAGRFHPYAVTVRLDDSKPWEKHPDLRQYGEISLTYADARPEGFPRVVTYPLWS